MATTYEACGTDVNDLIARVLDKSHAALKSHGLTVAAVFVTREHKKLGHLPGMKRQGFPIAAKIQITPLADRARGESDAKLTICTRAWGRLNENAKVALIDHELEHLEMAFTKKGGGTDDSTSTRCGGPIRAASFCRPVVARPTSSAGASAKESAASCSFLSHASRS